MQFIMPRLIALSEPGHSGNSIVLGEARGPDGNSTFKDHADLAGVALFHVKSIVHFPVTFRVALEVHRQHQCLLAGTGTPSRPHRCGGMNNVNLCNLIPFTIQHQRLSRLASLYSRFREPLGL